MLEEEKLNIAEYEAKGCKVVIKGPNNDLVYATGGHTDSRCYDCPDCVLLPDPDPYDWFRDGDMRLYCQKLCLTIQGSLEYAREWEAVERPIYCPLLANTLNDEQKKEAAEALACAKRIRAEK